MNKKPKADEFRMKATAEAGVKSVVGAGVKSVVESFVRLIFFFSSHVLGFDLGI